MLFKRKAFKINMSNGIQSETQLPKGLDNKSISAMVDEFQININTFRQVLQEIQLLLQVMREVEMLEVEMQAEVMVEVNFKNQYFSIIL